MKKITPLGLQRLIKKAQKYPDQLSIKEKDQLAYLIAYKEYTDQFKKGITDGVNSDNT